LIYFERKTEAALRLQQNGKKKERGVDPSVLVPRRDGQKGEREKRGEEKKGEENKGNMK